MFVESILTCSLALLLVYLFIPSLWLYLVSSDDALDLHNARLALVASRNPFKDDGQVACMAKLIMMRHKVRFSPRKQRRAAPHSRQAARSYNLSAHRSNNPWLRFGRPFGKFQSH
ncbi:hypothetical protein BDV98DRAFT_499806 [Pterulicium gracile]|uniref:Uncharacterized protein n=1 Tax=Pterulicium gracile TaxID=1884261 RepID=A0A5C3R3T1_9AGAR|nr:hypothetical protein BDV98DRAFT_499806 [Pterula gracilis]